MISPENYILFGIILMVIVGVANILLAICRSEKIVKTHYGLSEGIAGLLYLGAAVVMVVI